MGTPQFGILTNPYPNRFGDPRTNMGIAFFCFFQSRTRSATSHQKLRLSQRHGAPLLAENLGSQYSVPANQELGKQEKGRLLLTSPIEGAPIEGVVQRDAQPHLAQTTTTQKQLQLSSFSITIPNLTPQ
jgi:hypothetical protein